MRRDTNRLLTPLEIQSQMGGGKIMLPTDNHSAKIIRFYANATGLQTEKPMDILTIDDLKAEGFVAARYKTIKSPTTGKFGVACDPDHKRLVHQSVPVADSSASINTPDYDYPVVSYVLGYGWEAKWGAVRFPLRNEVELWRFMRLFDYPISIDQKVTDDGRQTN